jgi:predicted transcriptional regulator
MDKDLLKKLIDKDYSQNEIAKEIGVSQTTIRHYLRKYSLYTKRTLDKNNTDPIRKKYYTKCIKCGSKCSKNSTICFSCWANSRKIKSLEDTKDRKIAKRILIEKRGYYCEVCKNNIWNDKAISLELHHIDGNSDNNSEENLQLLCPNCHSQTDTYKGKNKVASEIRRKHRETREFKVL